MMRLFIAMPLSHEIEQSLARIIFDLKQTRANVKWVAAQNIHLTLKFLGDTDENKVNAIKEIIAQTSQKYSAVDSEINKVGAFPNLRRPRVIWAGLAGGIETLATISRDLEEQLEPIGFEKEKRAFKSHLTLGRVKSDSGLNDLAEAIEKYEMAPEKIRFDKIILFKSTLTPSGPIYDKLFESGLKSE